jgi:hypothetical protein
MTLEHVPPRSTGNNIPVRQIIDPIGGDDLAREVRDWRDGHAVRSLCSECNLRASRWGYVSEYRKWHDLVIVEAHRKAKRGGNDPLRGTEPFEFSLPYDAMPARFVRQVIGMFLAVQEAEHLLASYPILADLIGPEPHEDRRRSEGLSIKPLRVLVSVANTKLAYVTKPLTELAFSQPASVYPTLWTPPGAPTQTHDIFLLALTPFLLILTDSGDPHLGIDVGDWTVWAADQRPKRAERSLALSTADQVSGGIRSMLYPADCAVDQRSPKSIG